MKTASKLAAIVILCAVGAIAFTAATTHAGVPDCPSSWPAEPGERFFTDSQGAEWFVIRSTDSNGYQTARAYPADDGYRAGYRPGSPDEVCNLLVRRPDSAEDLEEAKQVTFRRDRDPEPAPVVVKTLFREFYDRMIPDGPYGPNPNPTWGHVFPAFTDEERSCITAALGEEGLAAALQSEILHDGEARLSDILIFGCLSNDSAFALSFAIAFAALVHHVAATGEENSCFQELLEPAVAALSKPSPTEEELLPVFAFFFGLESCGLASAEPPSDAPGG